MRGIHDDAGHQGQEKTLWLAKQRFYWPGLERDIVAKVASCPRCIRRKTGIKPVATLQPISSTYPMELVCIDFLSLERSKGGFEHILVITDHFTRYAQAIPCRNQTAQTTARALYENFFRFYSFPARLHSDQGRNFESRVIKELCKLAQTQKTRTTPYHPMGNGSAERFNQTLLKMLGTLENHQKSDWKSYLGPLVQAYNATKSDATGFSPHFLMFGWHPRLSVDAYLGIHPTPEEAPSGPQSYGKQLKSRLQFAYEQAANHARKCGEKNKAIYDRTVKESALEKGDRVLVRKVGIQGKAKLADKWDEDSYIVLSIPDPLLPVYKVKQERGTKVRTLHRNMLLPFDFMPLGEPQQPSLATSRPKSTRKSQPEPESSDTDSSESEENLGIYVIPQKRVILPENRPLRFSSSRATSGFSDPPSYSGHQDTPSQHTSHAVGRSGLNPLHTYSPASPVHRISEFTGPSYSGPERTPSQRHREDTDHQSRYFRSSPVSEVPERLESQSYTGSGSSPTQGLVHDLIGSSQDSLQTRSRFDSLSGRILPSESPLGSIHARSRFDSLAQTTSPATGPSVLSSASDTNRSLSGQFKPQTPPRRSGRHRKPPDRYGDWIA